MNNASRITLAANESQMYVGQTIQHDLIMFDFN